MLHQLEGRAHIEEALALHKRAAEHLSWHVSQIADVDHLFLLSMTAAIL